MEKLPFIQEVGESTTDGKLATLITPSKATVTIREQNGSDDDVISAVSQKDESTPFNNFIAGIIVDQNFDFVSMKGPITVKQVLDMPLRDKYFILMASRAFSISPILKFQWDWKDGRPPVSYEEDLTQYLPNFSKEDLPKPGEPGYFKYRVEPYESTGVYYEFDLISGKRVRYKMLDGHGENYILKLPENQANINTQLRARFIELFFKNSQEWIKVEDFKVFSTRDMAEIRAHVEKYDKSFDGLTDIQNPYTKATLTIPLLSIPDFFFPRQI